MELVMWLLKTAGILVIFQLIAPAIIDGRTRNSWIKLPAFLLCAIVAAMSMAFLHYMPFLLFWLWIAWTLSTLAHMKTDAFQSSSGIVIDRPVFYVSHLSYVIVACALAYILQLQITPQGTGSSVLLWKHLVGLT